MVLLNLKNLDETWGLQYDRDIVQTFTRESYLPTPLLGQDMTQGQFFKRSLTGLNSEFSFSLTSCLTKAEEPSLPYYLPISGGRIIGFIPFPRVLVLCEMQSVSSRICTRVAVCISYDDNHYTTSISNHNHYTTGTSGCLYQRVVIQRNFTRNSRCIPLP